MHKDLHTEILFDEPLFVVCWIQSPWASRRKIAMSDLIDEPWAPPQQGSEVGDREVRSFIPAAWRSRTRRSFAARLKMSWNLLATGRFLTVLPLSLLRFGQSAQRSQDIADQACGWSRGRSGS